MRGLLRPHRGDPLLLARGAKPDLKDATGASAADWAGAGSRDAAGDVLAKAGSQLNPFLNVGVMPFALMDKAGAAKMSTSGTGG